VDIAELIRQRAQERGVDPNVALSIAQTESSLRPGAKNPRSTARGLFQVTDGTWKQYGGDPKKRGDINEDIRVGLDIIADNTQALTQTLGREPSLSEVYAAHFFGKAGARKILSADPNAPVSDVVSRSVMRANPEILKGRTVAEAINELGRRVGDESPSIATSPESVGRGANRARSVPAVGRPVGRGYREDPANPPIISRAVQETDALGPGYQAALALSYLADTEESSDDENDPSIVEREAAAELARPQRSSAAQQLAQMDFGYAPVVGQQQQQEPLRLADGGEVSDPYAQMMQGAPRQRVSPGRFARGMLDTGAGMLKGATQAAIGMPGDIESLIRMGVGSEREAVLPTTDRVKAFIDQYAPLGLPADEGTGGRTAAEYFGEFMSPAAATRPLVRGAQAVGEGVMEGARRAERALDQPVQDIMRRGGTAAELLESFSTVPAQAVRERGTPLALYRPASATEPPVDQAQRFVQTELATTGDDVLNKWFTSKVTPYLRRDFGTTDDQFVKAADEGKLLHMARKPRPDDMDPLTFSERSALNYIRPVEGYPVQGTARTPYGQRIEDLVDSTIAPAHLQDYFPGNVDRLPQGIRRLIDESPEMRVTEIDEERLVSLMRLPNLRDGMLEMRRMPSEYSAYNQRPVKVPDEYRLSDQALTGLTPAQASNRVALFRKWRDETRQKMASEAVTKDPRLERQKLDDFTLVKFPDLENYPEMRKLVTDVGCDGKWCTQTEANALSYGSGDARLEILFDKKARPVAQITVERAQATSDNFLLSMSQSETDAFLRANPNVALYDDRAIQQTPEFLEWSRRTSEFQQPRVTDILGTANETRLADRSFTPALQQYLKKLEAENPGMIFGSDLENTGLRQFFGDRDDLLEYLEYGQRARLSEIFEGMPSPAVGDQAASAVTAEVRRLNGGSLLIPLDKDKAIDLVRQAAQNVMSRGDSVR